MIALLGLRLTPCQWSILRLLLAHPLLSDEELAAFLGLQRRSVRCSLYELHQLGCLEPIATEVGKRWHLCERGLRLIAAANHMHIRNIAALSDDGAESETSTVVQRGEAWLLTAYPAHCRNLRLLCQVGAGRKTRTRTGTLLVGDGGSVRTPLPGG